MPIHVHTHQSHSNFLIFKIHTLQQHEIEPSDSLRRPPSPNHASSTFNRGCRHCTTPPSMPDFHSMSLSTHPLLTRTFSLLQFLLPLKLPPPSPPSTETKNVAKLSMYSSYLRFFFCFFVSLHSRLHP